MKVNFIMSKRRKIKVIFLLSMFMFSFGYNSQAILTIPTVTINQKSGQADPTSSVPVIFRVVFATAINLSTFTISDINTSQSTAPGVTVESITEVAPFNNRSFDVAISATGSGTIVATIPISELIFTPSILGTTDSNPQDITFDNLGNLYTVNLSSDSVTKITPGGVSSVHGTTGTSPADIAIDSSGNIYTANSGSDDVTKITPGGVSSIFGTTGSNPLGIAIDINDNIYTANSGSDNVTKITPGGVSSVFGTTGSSPSDIIIDSSDNIYTANTGSNNVTKITPGGVSTILGTTGTSPLGITIDSSDNIYTANSGSDNVTKITPGGMSSVLGTTGSSPSDIDSDGLNVYTSNTGSNNVSKITQDGESSIIGITGSNPQGIDVVSNAIIYTTNGGSDNVTKFSGVPNGYGGVLNPSNGIFFSSDSTDNSIAYIKPSGGSIIFSNPPRIPEGGLVVQINNGAISTSSPDVVLSFNTGPDITHVVVSNSVDFSNTNLELYSPTKSWNVCSIGGSSLVSPCAYGSKNVYVKFYTSSGGSSAILSATINYQSTEISVVENQTPTVIQNPPIAPDEPLESFNFSNNSLYNLLKGKILLKVDDSGKSYYVHHRDKKIFYLGRPNDAFEVMRQQAVGISNADLKKIPVGVASMSGLDQDNDGLTDILEDALGTDKTKADSDGDGYVDRIEIENSYDPLGIGKQVFDLKFVKQHLGHFVLQVEGKGEAWYLNPNDSKRYFLGRLTDVFNIMKKMSFGITNEDFNSLF